VIFKLSKFNYITVFDARSGYWHIPVKKESQPLLGFATHHGLWQWTRTAFGCKNSGSSFIRAIEQVLKPVRDIVATYVDDMGVGAFTWDEHLVNLRRFLTIIQANGVRLNLEKTEFAKSRVKFLGKIVGSNEISMDPTKIEAIVSIQRPTTMKMLKSFLGVINFHREFIPHMSCIAKPLTDLTSQKKCKALAVAHGT
jgi:Reverse transcriptase (RNA-dependent DNA polymerase)